MSRHCHCGANATVYAGGPYAGDWAGLYCNRHIPDGFQVWDRFDNEGSNGRAGACLRCGDNLNGLAHPHNCRGKG